MANKTIELNVTFELTVSEKLLGKLRNTDEQLIEFVLMNAFRNNARKVIEATIVQEVNHLTIEEARDEFWTGNPEYKRESGKTHNDYETDIRVAFRDHLIELLNDGRITEGVANQGTLA